MFEQVFVEQSARTRRPFTVAVSFGAQVCLVAAAVLIPLMHNEVIAPGRLLRIVTAPRLRNEIGDHPVTPNKMPAPRTAATPVFTMPTRSLTQPSQVPAHVVIDPGEAPSGMVMPGSGAAGGPDGIPDGIANTIAPPRIEPPPKPRPVTSPAVPPLVRVGGVVQAARLIRQIKPTYPPLARQARISGVVMLEAMIAKDGTIRSLHLISGHPLLVRSAIDAVEQWMYRPTLLNGEPAEVLTQIEVRFTISE